MSTLPKYLSNSVARLAQRRAHGARRRRRARQIVTQRASIARASTVMARDDDPRRRRGRADRLRSHGGDGRRAARSTREREVEEGEVTARDARDARRAATTTTRDDDAMLDVDDPTRVEMARRRFQVRRTRRGDDRGAEATPDAKARARVRRRRDGRRRCERRFESNARAGRSTRRARPGAGIWRRRTKAGCFLWVFKRAHGGAKLEAALRESKAVDKALRARRRGEFGRRGGARGRGRGRG